MPTPTSAQPESTVTQWPTVESAIAPDPAIEEAVAALLGTMTLEQKVGQMVQAEIKDITPEQVKRHHIGSVLNGGGSWPNQNKHAKVADWVALADAYYGASMDTSADENGSHYLAIPILWGTDAVHGHSNVMGATVFPHNIGLGATGDPELVGKTAAITAKEIAVTGIDWTFSPTLAVVRDFRWGRTYEGYSSDPELVKRYAAPMVEALQGKPGGADADAGAGALFSASHVIATAKHYIGDGGTQFGKDQGDTLGDEQSLIDIHAQGYFSALRAGAQSVMASFSSWNGEKMHGHKYLLTDILRGRLGFDGIVISDWNGHGQLPASDNTRCAAAINAGIDMIMVPHEWEAFLANTIDQVRSGEISATRIDESVTRILRVKMRAGLFGPRARDDKGRPSSRPLAGNADLLGCDAHRAVAREAVRKSLVLLKNKGNTLPLSKSANVLVAGPAADDIGTQSGGWTLTWQGTENENGDFPNADSIFAGINGAVNAGGGSAKLSPDGSAASEQFDVAVVVVGEMPYAEGQGDISRYESIELGGQISAAAQVFNTIRERAPNLPTVTILLSGRPLYANRELNHSSAFIAAWLPGSEGAGIADVLFGDFDFTGKLTIPWPAHDRQTALCKGNDSEALFPFGYGLTYNDTDNLPDNLPEQTSEPDFDPADGPLTLFESGANRSGYVLRIGGPSNWSGISVTQGQTTLPDGEVKVATIDGRIQGSAKQVTWNGTGQVYSQLANPLPGADLTPYAEAQTALAFRVRVDELDADSAPVISLSMHCEWPCHSNLAFGPTLRSLDLGRWYEIRIPLQRFIENGLKITRVNTPFLIYGEGRMTLTIEDIRWEPKSANMPADEPTAADGYSVTPAS